MLLATDADQMESRNATPRDPEAFVSILAISVAHRSEYILPMAPAFVFSQIGDSIFADPWPHPLAILADPPSGLQSHGLLHRNNKKQKESKLNILGVPSIAKPKKARRKKKSKKNKKNQKLKKKC